MDALLVLLRAEQVADLKNLVLHLLLIFVVVQNKSRLDGLDLGFE